MYQPIVQFAIISSLVILTIGIKFARAEVDGNYSEKERVALKKFRTMVPDAILYKNYMKEDDFLIRWIRDRNFDMDQANQKLRTSLKWRIDNRIDSVVNEDFSSLSVMCPFEVDAEDREHRPVITFSVAKCDLRKVGLQGNLPRLNRAIYWVIETCLGKLMEARNRTGLNVRTGMLIADEGGFNLRQHGCIRCLPLILTLFETYENHYPEYMEIAYFINVPRLARGIIELFLPLISQRSRDIAKFYGHDKAEWQAEILSRVSPDQLLPIFGGTKGTKQRL